MLKITIEVDAPSGKAIGIKEDLAMYVEKYGDTRVVSIEEIDTQMQIVELDFSCIQGGEISSERLTAFTPKYKICSVCGNAYVSKDCPNCGATEEFCAK